MATAAFRKEHNVVTVLHEEESRASVLGKLSQIAY